IKKEFPSSTVAPSVTCPGANCPATGRTWASGGKLFPSAAWGSCSGWDGRRAPSVDLGRASAVEGREFFFSTDRSRASWADLPSAGPGRLDWTGEAALEPETAGDCRRWVSKAPKSAPTDSF